jgi:hypothetical protein
VANRQNVSLSYVERSARTGVEAILITWRRRWVRRGLISTAGNHVEAVRSSFGRAPRNANRLPPPFAAEHALLECRRVLRVSAGAGLLVAKIKVGLKDCIAARLSVGTHQVVIRVVGMVGLRSESSYEKQSANDDRAFHGIVLWPDGLALSLLDATLKRSSRRLRRENSDFCASTTTGPRHRHAADKPDELAPPHVPPVSGAIP